MNRGHTAHVWSPREKRNLGLFLCGRVTDTVGQQVQGVAVGWQVWQLTHDELMLGYVGLAQFAPLMLLALLGGTAADRFDRRRIVGITQLGYAVGALGLVWASGHGTTPTFVVLVGLGALRAFKWPAASALVPWLVSRERLPRAIALSASTFQVGMIAGPAIGGAIYVWGGAEAAYWTTVALELVSAALTLSLKVSMPEREPRGESQWQLVLGGVRFLIRTKVILGAIGLDLFAVLFGGAVALMPVFADEILHVGPVGLGLLRGAPALGAMIVLIVLAYRPIERRAGPWMLGGVALFGVATIVFGSSSSFGLSLAALAIVGGADAISVVVRQSLIQLRTPDEMRGRVAAVSFVFIGASNELGELESGVTAKWLGAARATIFGGIGTLLVTGLWTMIFPTLRDVDKLTAHEDEES